MTSNLIQTVSDNVAKHQLFQKGETLLVSVSGGCDSLALILVLMDLHEEYSLDLHVVHFDHGLRPESVKERQFIEVFAHQHQLSCYIHTSNQLALESSGIQEKARLWRLEKAEETRKLIKAHHIVTAHHADDQTETMLLKLLRGCHLTNLQGMEWINQFHIRPLLNCKKSELQSFLKSKSQPWMEDKSNQSPKYLRNQIRLELVPLLDELARGELQTRLNDLADQSQQLKTWINQTYEGFLAKQDLTEGIPIEPLLMLPQLVQETVLRQYLMNEGVSAVDYSHMKNMIAQLHSGNHQWELHLPGKKTFKRNGQKLRLYNKPSLLSHTIKNNSQTITYELNPIYNIRCQPIDPQKPIPTEGMILFNIPPDAHLKIRYRLPGDRFHPHWKQKPIKLKDFLRDQNIPLHQRDSIPLICHDSQILAVYPHHLSSHNKIDQNQYPPLHLLIFQEKT